MNILSLVNFPDKNPVMIGHTTTKVTSRSLIKPSDTNYEELSSCLRLPCKFFLSLFNSPIANDSESGYRLINSNFEFLSEINSIPSGGSKK